ncbi:hypothetical protein FSP39_018377 [Pinctada imbricata]|uniref:Neurotransmitter-gated ion-channel ligand-binding domain-containing protein n=1 Tax=Pinctada imbricata TaxID=66713 RepID=A0AA89C527_PINIB|nr:hypothetical protein FSP39_018377 [Pinctada imbricata]
MVKCVLLLLCCISAVNIRTVISTTASDWKFFFDSIFVTYNKNVLPKVNQSELLTINVGYTLNAIKSFDEVSGVMETVGYLTVSWTNELLQWDEKPVGTSDYIRNILIPISMMWYPPITLQNSVTSLKGLGTLYEKLDSSYTGLTTWKPPVILASSCSVDTTNFPWDEQACNLTFVAWDYKATEVLLAAASPTVDMTEYSENQVWVINETTTVAWTDADSSYVTFTIKLKRLPVWFVINIIAPLVLLSFLNLFVFLTPLEEGRVGYAMGAFLTFSVYLEIIGDNIPPVSEPMSNLSIYVVLQVIVSGITSFISVFTVRIYTRDNDIPVPVWMSYFIGIIACHVCVREEEREIKKLFEEKNAKSVEPGTGFPDLPKRSMTVLRIESIKVEELSPLIKFGVPNVKWTPLDAEKPVREIECCIPQPYITWINVAKVIDYFLFLGSIAVQMVMFVLFMFPMINQYDGSMV